MAKPTYVAGHFKPGYNVFNPGLSERGIELFDSLIMKRLPDDAVWCGDEILCDCVWDDKKERYVMGDCLDVDGIVSAAAEELIDRHSDDDDIWDVE